MGRKRLYFIAFSKFSWRSFARLLINGSSSWITTFTNPYDINYVTSMEPLTLYRWLVAILQRMLNMGMLKFWSTSMSLSQHCLNLSMASNASSSIAETMPDFPSPNSYHNLIDKLKNFVLRWMNCYRPFSVLNENLRFRLHLSPLDVITPANNRT